MLSFHHVSKPVVQIVSLIVGDPDPEPDLQIRIFLGFPDPDPLVRGMDPDPYSTLFS